MKKFVLNLILTFLGSYWCVGQANHVLIKSDLRNLHAREYVKLLRWNGETYATVDSIRANGGNTLQTEIEKPEIAFLEIGKNKAIPIFLTAETFLLSGDATKHKTLSIKGNEEQNVYNRYLFLLDAFDKRMEKLDFEREKARNLNKINENKRLTTEMQKVTGERADFMEKFAVTHATSMVSAYIAKTILPNLNIAQLQLLVRHYAENNLEDPIITEIKNRLTILQNTTIGKEIPDFTFTRSDGKTASIRDLKGKYTLIYFWAAWCSNCLKEVQKLQTLYKTYEGRGFEILAISLDTDKLRWQKKLKDENIQWINVCDLIGEKSPYVSTFGVTAIPAAFLLDIDNVIIENKDVLEHLEEKLDQLLGKQY